MKKKKTTK